MLRFSSRAALRRRSITTACWSCVPWEKFSRATSMPSSMRSRIISSELLTGPMVQTTLARRRDEPGLRKGSSLGSKMSGFILCITYDAATRFGAELKSECAPNRKRG